MRVQKSSHVLKKESDIVEEVLLNNKAPMKLKEIMDFIGGQIEWRKNPTNQMKTYIHQNKNITKDGYGKYIHVDNADMYGSSTNNSKLKLHKDFRIAYSNESLKDKKEKSDSAESENKDDSYADFLPEGVSINDYNEALKKFDKRVNSQEGKESTENNSVIKKGSVVEGHVSGITDYGVFVENNIIGLNGLIHISNVKHEPVSDLNRYFKVGDKIKATIIEIKSDNKVSLSTKDIPLNDYYSERPDYLNKELELLISYVKSSTGIISEKSRNILEDAIDKYNLVNVSLAVNKIHEEYTGDLSYKFMMDVLNELKVDYSVYDIEDHAIEKWNDRVNKPIIKSEIIDIVSKSQIILENLNYRYHKHNDLIFPCKKENGVCIIKTVLNNYMYINEKK